ncbi:MAG TPA: ABC transporter substrate-binding protein [Chloroflexota bacterium]|nr:ABC transporter substrate-binding protein [Chloroflexota bacterium]
MSKDSNGTRGHHPSRRDFLATSAKIGAGVALAGAGLDLAPRKANAAGVTLNYIGNIDNIFPHSQQGLLKQFEALHPGVTCNFVAAPNNGSSDAYHNKLVTIFAAHDGSIDVFDSDVIWQASWAPAGWAAPLDKVFPASAQKNYVGAMITADTVGGHIYGIPWLFDVGHLFYRKDILDANGLKPATTWQELVRQCLLLKKKYPSMIGYVGCGEKGQQLICNFMEFAWGNGGDMLDAKGNVVFNSSQNVEALSYLVDMVNKYKITQPGFVSMPLDTGRAIFTQGNAIYHRNWNYAYAGAQAVPKIAGKVGAVNVPTFPGFPPGNCAGGWQYVVNEFSANRDLAIELALFMGSKPAQKWRTLNGSQTPAYLSLCYDPQVDAKYPAYPVLAEQAKFARSRPKTPYWIQMSQSAEAELTNALTKSKSPKQALNDASAQIEKILSGNS